MVSACPVVWWFGVRHGREHGKRIGRRRPHRTRAGIPLACFVFLLPALAQAQTATSTPSGTPTATGTATPTGALATPTPSPTDTPRPPTGTPTRTETGTVTRTPTRTPTRTATPTRTQTATRTQTITRTITQTPTATASSTATESASPTRTRTATRTATASPSRTGTRTPTRTVTPTRTRTGTRTVTPTRTRTGTPTRTGTATDTPTVTPTSTPAAASISVARFADNRGDNLDGTFTTLVVAFLTDELGNPVGDGTTVTFTLVDPPIGVVITFTGRTNRLPDCDIQSFEEDTGIQVEPQPGRAFSCLRYLESLEGDIVRVRASVPASQGIIEETRSIRLPAGPTPTPTITPTSTETFTPSPTATPTPTSTNTATATVTETPSVDTRIAVSRGVVRPGEVAEIDVDLVDKADAVFELQFDLLFEQAVFTFTNITQRCVADERLESHSLSVSVAFDPNVPPGQRRFRYVFFNLSGTPTELGSGPLVHCRLPVVEDAPVGPTRVTLDQVLPGDAEGNLISGVLSVDGEVLVDPDLPTPTPTSTVTPSATPTETATQSPIPTETPTSTATETPTVTPTSTATSTPPPSVTPTPTEPPCVGDCNGDREVTVDELVLGVGIAGGTFPLDDCPAFDADDGGGVTVDELVAGVGNAIRGCGDQVSGVGDR